MTLHAGLTRAIEDARDHSRKNFNVVKESYGQYLARAILASDVIAQVRAETLKGLLSEFGEWADEMTFVVGNELDEDMWRDVTVREYITWCIDEIEREAGLK